MENVNVNVLLEIISELRAENKDLKISDKEKEKSLTYWFDKVMEMEKEQKEVLTASLS